MKKSSKHNFFIIFLSAVLTIVNFMSVHAAQIPEESGITVFADGNSIASEQKPLIIDGHVMVPATATAEEMGWVVRANSPAVYQFVKTVKYTDGIREYLFSCHTSTINLDYERISRSIMIGVGHFLDTADDRKISFTVKPIVKDGILLMSIEDLAKCLYADVYNDEENQTVSIISGVIPYYDGQGLPNRDELFEEMRKYNKITGTLTKTGEQIFEPDELKPVITTLFQPAGVMTEAPKVGSFPAKILLPDKTDVKSTDSYYEPYKYNVGHGCNWFAFGRFYEVYGYQIPVPYTGGETYLNAVEKSNTALVKAERDFDKIVSGCVAVYWRTGNGGHVVFVEFVERDADGNPVNIYYTECRNADGSGVYKPKTDAKIIKVTFERFKKSSSNTKDLVGFIIPQS